MEKSNQTKKFFIGLDSDGTAFDTMTIKHTKVFIPVAIKTWHLQKHADSVKEICERINLYSSQRGINRFPGLLQMFEDLRKAKIPVPDYSSLKDFVNSDFKYSNTELERYIREKNDCEFLKSVHSWSIESDKLFSKEIEGLMPFKFVKESLEKAHPYADIAVISSASSKGLIKDWKSCGLDIYTSVILGQESGSKIDQLKTAALGKYESNNIIMIGDALGDLTAAQSINALFFPIVPLREEESWKRFYEQGLDRFLRNEFDNDYQENLINELKEMLT